MAAQIDGDNAMVPTEKRRLRCKEGVIAAPPMHEKNRRRPAAKLFVSESDAIVLHYLHGSIEFRCPVTGRLRKPIFISLEASSNYIAAVGEQAVARNKS
jgi:hypothetical protein